MRRYLLPGNAPLVRVIEIITNYTRQALTLVIERLQRFSFSADFSLTNTKQKSGDKKNRVFQYRQYKISRYSYPEIKNRSRDLNRQNKKGDLFMGQINISGSYG